MSQRLADEVCVPCRADSPRLTPEAARLLLRRLPSWRIAAEAGMDRLSATFDFDNFASALAFAGRVGELAEAADHHPRIVVEWGRASVQWWTHAIGGLHRNDFIMAARTDAACQAGR